MGHVYIAKYYVIPTVTYCALTTELWLSETFVIIPLPESSFRNAGHFVA